VPDQKNIPVRLANKNLFPLDLSSKAKKRGTKPTHANIPRIENEFDKASKAADKKQSNITFRSISYIFSRNRKGRGHCGLLLGGITARVFARAFPRLAAH